MGRHSANGSSSARLQRLLAMDECRCHRNGCFKQFADDQTNVLRFLQTFLVTRETSPRFLWPTLSFHGNLSNYNLEIVLLKPPMAATLLLAPRSGKPLAALPKEIGIGVFWAGVCQRSACVHYLVCDRGGFRGQSQDWWIEGSVALEQPPGSNPA